MCTCFSIPSVKDFSTEELNEAILSTVDGVSVFDKEGKIVYTNKSYEDFYGYTKAELIGRPWADLIHKDDHKQMENAIRGLVASKRKELEIRGVKKHNEIIYQRAMLVHRNGYYFQSIKDITEQKMYELKLVDMLVSEATKDQQLPSALLTKDGLYAEGPVLEVGPVTISLIELIIAAKNKAQHSSEMKSAFVANISHEIRTPINGIVGMASLLETSSLTSDQSENVHIILDSANSLLGIINDILDFSKIESGSASYDVCEFDMVEFMNTLSSIYKMTMITKQLALNIHINPNIATRVKTDKNKLRQILTNLINNAVKFTNYGAITIVVSKVDGLICFEVKDTGIGISSDKLTVVFDPFVQADASINRNYGGTGLGLSICKKLVEMMDGNISIQSKLGSGTTVCFTIPCCIGEDVVRFDKKGVRRLKKDDPCVVIVEDNKTNQIVLEKIVKQAGYTDLHILVYGNGKEAFDGMDDFKHLTKCMILMDLHMPEMDGFACTKLLRSNGIAFPIITVSANADIIVRENCLAGGMNDFYLKPITVKDVKKMFKAWFV